MESRLQGTRNVAELLQTQLNTGLQDLFFRTLDGVVFNAQGEVRPEIQSQHDVQSNLSKEFPRLHLIGDQWSAMWTAPPLRAPEPD